MKVLGRNFSLWSGCCFSVKHATLRRKSKDWLARNQDGVKCLSTDYCFGEPAL